MDELVTVDTYPLDPLCLVTRAAALGQPPLDNILGAILFRSGLRSDWWVRFPAALLGSASVFLLGVWGKRLAGDRVGLLAATLLAVCPMHLCMSQEARPYALTFFLALMCGLLYVRAREIDRTRDWIGYFAGLLALLMARWTDPHFVVLGIILHAVASWHRAAKTLGQRANHETLQLRKTLVTTATAYLVYAPFFIIILSMQKSAIRPPSTDWVARFFDLLHEAFASLFTGYSARTLFSAYPGSTWLVLLGACATAAGLMITFRSREIRDTAPWWIYLPIPLVYGVVYAMLGNALPKPQYLLLMAIIVIPALSLTLERVRTGPGWPRIRQCVFAVLVLVFVIPMSQASWNSLVRLDKIDWRSAMKSLKEHAREGDEAVCMGSDTVVPAFRPNAFGRNRYGPEFLKILPLSSDTGIASFSESPWQSTHNTVWMLVYTDRMYSGSDQIEPPPVRAYVKSVRKFNGLILVELSGEATALQRLVATINDWYDELPAGKSFSAPAILLWRLAQNRSDAAMAERSLGLARRQCSRPQDLDALGALAADHHRSFENLDPTARESRLSLRNR